MAFYDFYPPCGKPGIAFIRCGCGYLWDTALYLRCPECQKREWNKYAIWYKSKYGIDPLLRL